jgi:hypothetical protein
LVLHYLRYTANRQIKTCSYHCFDVCVGFG